MRRTFWLVILLAALLAVATPALAQEVGEPGVEEEHASPLDVVFRWVNFIILFGGLGYLLRQPAAEFFETRRATILGGLERARAAQADADKRMSGIEGRLANLSEDLASIRSEAEASARSERDRIVADAKLEVDRALEQSREEVERMVRGLELEIRGHIADLVLVRAEQELRNRIDDQARGRLLGRALQELQVKL